MSLRLGMAGIGVMLVIGIAASSINPVKGSAGLFHDFVHSLAPRPVVDHMPPADFRSPRKKERDRAGVPIEYGYPPDVPNIQPEYPNGPIVEPIKPPVSREPVCRTETKKVPSESGGQVTIRVTRCH